MLLKPPIRRFILFLTRSCFGCASERPLVVPFGTHGQHSIQAVASRSVMTLQETLFAQVPEKQKALAALKKEHGNHVIGEVTIDQCIGGARGVKCMLWETSNLDPEEGIRFRGLTIPDC